MTGHHKSRVRALEADDMWRKIAACAGEDPNIFHPIPTGVYHSTEDLAVVAKSFCNVCPVRIQCLEYALANEGTMKERDGIYGGMTGPERYAIAMERRS